MDSPNRIKKKKKRDWPSIEVIIAKVVIFSVFICLGLAMFSVIYDNAIFCQDKNVNNGIIDEFNQLNIENGDNGATSGYLIHTLSYNGKFQGDDSGTFSARINRYSSDDACEVSFDGIIKKIDGKWVVTNIRVSDIDRS